MIIALHAKNQNVNVLGGKFLKTNAAAINATTNVIAAIAQKDATGGKFGQTDALFQTTNVIVDAVATN